MRRKQYRSRLHATRRRIITVFIILLALFSVLIPLLFYGGPNSQGL